MSQAGGFSRSQAPAWERRICQAPLGARPEAELRRSWAPKEELGSQMDLGRAAAGSWRRGAALSREHGFHKPAACGYGADGADGPPEGGTTYPAATAGGGGRWTRAVGGRQTQDVRGRLRAEGFFWSRITHHVSRVLRALALLFRLVAFVRLVAGFGRGGECGGFAADDGLGDGAFGEVAA